MSATSKLGSLLRRLRKEKKLTQAAVAELSGLTRVHIANLETGKRGGDRTEWQTMLGLARAFGMPPDEFAKLLDAEVPVNVKARLGRPKASEPSAKKRKGA